MGLATRVKLLTITEISLVSLVIIYGDSDRKFNSKSANAESSISSSNTGAIALCVDLRKRVVNFVVSGSSKAEASRKYEVSLWCVNDWCRRKNLTPALQLGRKRKLDSKTLVQL